MRRSCCATFYSNDDVAEVEPIPWKIRFGFIGTAERRLIFLDSRILNAITQPQPPAC